MTNEIITIIISAIIPIVTAVTIWKKSASRAQVLILEEKESLLEKRIEILEKENAQLITDNEKCKQICTRLSERLLESERKIERLEEKKIELLEENREMRRAMGKK